MARGINFRVIEREVFRMRTVLEVVRPTITDDPEKRKRFDLLRPGSSFWWAAASSYVKITDMAPEQIKPTTKGSKIVFVVIPS